MSQYFFLHFFCLIPPRSYFILFFPFVPICSCLLFTIEADLYSTMTRLKKLELPFHPRVPEFSVYRLVSQKIMDRFESLRGPSISKAAQQLYQGWVGLGWVGLDGVVGSYKYHQRDFLAGATVYSILPETIGKEIPQL